MARDQITQEFILITSTNFPEGGASANYLNLFCKGLKYNDQKISVWLLKGYAFGNYTNKHKRNNITAEDIPFIYLSSTHRSKYKIKKIIDDLIAIFILIINLLGLIRKRNNIKILVYNNELPFNIPIYLISLLTGLKIITFVPEYFDKSTFKESFFRKIKWYGFLINFNYLNRLSFKLIVFSSYLKDIYIKNQVDEKKIIIQPNLTDFNFWQIEKTKTKYTLGYSGTPSLKDGLDDLLQAISILRKRNLDVTLLVIGDNTFGKSLLPELHEQCKTLEIDDLISFTGLIKLVEVKQYLSECMILALTRPNIIQTQAGFPTKLGEYFASGKTVLMTNFGDIEKYFIKDKDMIIAECGNINDIADNIHWIINNPEKAKIITDNGYLKSKLVLEYKSSIFNLLKWFES